MAPEGEGLNEPEQRNAALEKFITAAPVLAPRLHPNLAELYRQRVAHGGDTADTTRTAKPPEAAVSGAFASGHATTYTELLFDGRSQTQNCPMASPTASGPVPNVI